jgi:CBS domain-containing protein
MRVRDVMTSPVLSVTPDTPVRDALRLMLDKRISGLPVVDEVGMLVGLVSEGDFLRRSELGTEKRRSWFDFLRGHGRAAEAYAHSHGRTVSEVMSREVVTVSHNAPLEEAVGLMEKRHVRRLPVTDGEALGIVTRSDILRALLPKVEQACDADVVGAAAVSDEAIRESIVAEFKRQPWAPAMLIDVRVVEGVVELGGALVDERQRSAIRVIAENAHGVRAVKDRMVWIDPMSGMTLTAPDQKD